MLEIVKDVPPYMLADGNPARVRGMNKIGMDRRSLGTDAARSVKEAYRILYRSDLNVAQAIEQMRAQLTECEEIEEIIKFVKGSDRGIS